MLKKICFTTAYINGLLFLLYSCGSGPQRSFVFLEGFTQGTSYFIAYHSPDSTDYHDEIKQLFEAIDNSVSIYNPTSIISAINRNEYVEPDEYFIPIFIRALEISRESGGAFDITAAPLVNSWGFGFSERTTISPRLIDSLLHLVGWESVRLESGIIVKDHPGIMLDMNAIAKGYTVDVVSKFFDSLAITDYMIEVGGEIRLKGKNRNNQAWSIGVDKPVYDPAPFSREMQEILQFTGRSIATSGNYRKYYIKDGQKYAHTIDPFTGYPVQNSLLSATVIASTCMDADAWATAFMVMGPEKSMEYAQNNPELEAYFIYDLNGNSLVAYTSGIEEIIKRDSLYFRFLRFIGLR